MVIDIILDGKDDRYLRIWKSILFTKVPVANPSISLGISREARVQNREHIHKIVKKNN